MYVDVKITTCLQYYYCVNNCITYVKYMYITCKHKLHNKQRKYHKLYQLSVSFL